MTGWTRPGTAACSGWRCRRTTSRTGSSTRTRRRGPTTGSSGSPCAARHPGADRHPQGRTGNGGRIASGRRYALRRHRRRRPSGAVRGPEQPGRQGAAGDRVRPAGAGKPGPGLAGLLARARPDGGMCLNGANQVYTTEPAGRCWTRSTGSRSAGTTAGRATPGSGRPAPDRRIPSPAAGLGGCAVIERGLFIASSTGQRLYALPLDESGHPGVPADYLNGAYGRLRTVVAGADGALWLTTSNKDGAGKPTPQDDRVIRILPPAGSANSPHETARDPGPAPGDDRAAGRPEQPMTPHIPSTRSRRGGRALPGTAAGGLARAARGTGRGVAVFVAALSAAGLTACSRRPAGRRGTPSHARDGLGLPGAGRQQHPRRAGQRARDRAGGALGDRVPARRRALVTERDSARILRVPAGGGRPDRGAADHRGGR